MAEVKECDRALAATASWGSEKWLGNASWSGWVAGKLCARESPEYGAHDRHAEQYAQLRERVEKAEEERDEIGKRLAETLCVRNRMYDDYKAAHVEMLKLRVRAETAEEARDVALADAARWEEACEKSREREAKQVELANSLRDKLDRTLRELEELRVNATPSKAVIDAARLCARAYPSITMSTLLAEFILDLAPKRKTRIEVYVEGWVADGGEGDCYMAESVRREGIAQLKRQGLDPDEELPEGP